MAKKKRPDRAKKRTRKKEQMPLGKRNFQVFGLGLVVIAAGFVALAQEPWDSFISTVIAPILLVVGYCVIIPYAIIYREKKGTPKQTPEVNIDQS